MKIAGTTRDQIAQVVQGPLAIAVSIGATPTARTRTVGTVPNALNDLRLRQILDARDALGGIGQIRSWPRHGGTLRGNTFLLMLAACCDDWALDQGGAILGDRVGKEEEVLTTKLRDNLTIRLSCRSHEYRYEYDLQRPPKGTN